MSTHLDTFLARHRIEVQRHEHPPVMTVEESERLVPPLPGAKTKNLVLRDKKVNDASHAVEFVIDRRLWEAHAVHAHPLVNSATMVLPHASLERFLDATGHPPRVIDVPGREKEQA